VNDELKAPSTIVHIIIVAILLVIITGVLRRSYIRGRWRKENKAKMKTAVETLI
jgi:hypothetical protein